MQNTNKNELPGLGKIYAGQIHFSRIPVQYWQHRIMMVKALGLNALSIYVMWNYHEIQKGIFDFQTQNKNLPLFLNLAQKHNMMVLFRPGPYVCAQWDFGGMPARLLSIQGLVIRASNEKFLTQVFIYFKALAPIMKKFLRTPENPKGCIVMLQIENQYGFYGTDQTYIQTIRKMWKDLDIRTHQYYVDWSWFIGRSHWQGANIGINHFDKSIQQMQVRFFQKKGIVMGGEIYTGWMTHWTQKWGGKSIDKVLGFFKFLLENGNSFAMYMAHGGTNFGLTAGANGLNFKFNDYWGAITSYDYDAPINQQGSVTPKYMALRQLFQQYVKWEIPDIPNPIPMITINPIPMKNYAFLMDNLSQQSIKSNAPLLFQSQQLKMFNQGIVIYDTNLPKCQKTYIKMVIHDFALVYIGNKLIEVLDRTKYTNHGFTIEKETIQKYGNKLRILVQASGHINFDKNMETDKKGLYFFGGDIKHLLWDMYKCPLNFQQISKWQPPIKKSFQEVQAQQHPHALIGQFTLDKVGDVYLDVSAYGKGYLWINGRNLGRYWNIGPQKRLFCPGVWLKKGLNQIHVLNLWGPSGAPICGLLTLKDPELQDPQKSCNLM